MPKILLIEDDKFIIKAYKNSLEKAGLEVVLAYDGEDGFDKIKSEKPDLILLDLVIPKKDGFSLLSDLRLDKNLKDIPVVILSNLGQESDVKKSQSLGAVDYLIKANLTLSEVVNKVKEHLAAASTR